MNRLEAILYMDSIAFLQNKSSSCRDNNSDRNPESKSVEENGEGWTVEYIVDRVCFEMLELKDDAQGWEDYYPCRGQRKKYYERAQDAIRMAVGMPPPIFILNASDLTTRLQNELSEL